MLKFVQASGTPREIGFIHGSEAKAEVLHSLATYRWLFEVKKGMNWEQCIKKSMTFIKAIQDFDPDILEEMKGIAEGAGISFEDVLAMNCRSEIIFMKKDPDPEDPVEGCTAVAVVPELTADNHMYHAQSWDWTARQENGVFIIKIIQTGKPDILMLTEGGFIGKIGMNSQGIGLTLNAMSVPVAAEGVPLHVVMRGMLNAPTFVGSMSKVIKYRCASAANLMLSTRDGEVLDIEIAGDDYDVLYPDDGICVHSNHYLSERLKGKFKDLNRDSTISTHMRRGRASRLLHSIGRPIARTDLEGLFRDHAGYPDAICYHPDMYIPPHLSRGSTLSCIIMDMNLGVMYATVGRTCEQQFQFFKL